MYSITTHPMWVGSLSYIIANSPIGIHGEYKHGKLLPVQGNYPRLYIETAYLGNN
jgi:hypothetical protein